MSTLMTGPYLLGPTDKGQGLGFEFCGHVDPHSGGHDAFLPLQHKKHTFTGN